MAMVREYQIEHSMGLNQLEKNTLVESALALKLAFQRSLFPMVDKVSEIFCEIIRSQQKEIIEILNQKDNFKDFQNELYVQFGALKQKKETPEEVLKDTQAILENKDAILINIMPIHAIFAYRILRPLHTKLYEQESVKFVDAKIYIENTKKFVTRQEEKKVIPTEQFGVATSPVVCNKINEMFKPEIDEIGKHSNKLHKNSFGRFTVTYDGMLSEYKENNVLSAAGPSSHTLTLMTVVRMLEQLHQTKFSEDELRGYILAYFSYFGTAGFHSFFDVMKVFNLCIGKSCEMGNYVGQLNDSLLKSQTFKDLVKLFPEQLATKERYANNINLLFAAASDFSVPEKTALPEPYGERFKREVR